MAICRTLKHIGNKISVCLEVEATTFGLTHKKEKLSQKSSLSVEFDASIPDPVVFPPLTPTKKSFQRIRGLRPSNDYLVEINGTTAGVLYRGKEFTKTVNLIEGNNSFTIRLVRQGNSGNAVVIHIERDTQPPETLLTANENVVEDQAVTNSYFYMSFEVEEENDPTTTYFKVNGGFTRVFSDPVFFGDEGIFSIEFWSVDSVGNKEESKTRSLIIDKTPPPAPTIDINALPLKTNQLLLLVSGAKSTDAVTVIVNGAEANIIDSTHWDVIIPLNEEGINLIVANSYDLAGNESNPATASIIRDTIPPEMPTLITQIFRTRSSDLQLIGEHSQDTFSMQINGIPNLIVLTSPIRWRTDVDLVEGPNNFIVEALDDVGNISEALEFIITRDTTPPPPPFVDPVISPTNIANHLLSGSCSLDTVRIIINNDADLAQVNNDGTWTALVQLDGEALNTLEIQAEDDLGNRSLPTIVEIFLDRVPPLPPTIDFVTPYVNVSSILLQGDKTADSTQICVNGDCSGVIFPSPTRWMKIVPLIPGGNAFEVWAKDFVGNISSSVFAVTKYLPGPPSFTINNLPEKVVSSFIIITGTREDSNYIIINNSSQYVQYPDGLNAGTLWSSHVPLDVGINVFDIKTRDHAGNESVIQTVSIERIVSPILKKFNISSVYAFTSECSVLVDGKKAPVIERSDEIKAYFIEGNKPQNTQVFFNSLQLTTNGDRWQAILPISDLRAGPIQVSLQAIGLLESPVLVISNIVIARSLVAGEISFKIGGNVDVRMGQNSAIVITDYQYLHTPSPLHGVPLRQILIPEIFAPT